MLPPRLGNTHRHRKLSNHTSSRKITTVNVGCFSDTDRFVHSSGIMSIILFLTKHCYIGYVSDANGHAASDTITIILFDRKSMQYSLGSNSLHPYSLDNSFSPISKQM